LIYGGQEKLVAIGYTEVIFKTHHENFISQSRYVFCLNGGVVRLNSSKQEAIDDFTTEVEYIATSSAAKEIVWIKKFISDLVPSIVDPIELVCDNNGAITHVK